MINSRLYPVLKQVEKGKQNVYRRVSDYNREYDENIPYIADAKAFMDRNGQDDPDRFIIVSSSEPVAVKAAKYIVNRCFEGPESYGDEYEWEFELEFDEDDDILEDFHTISILDLSKVKNPDIVPYNAYISGITEEADGDVAMYEGLNSGNDLRDKIDAILVDERVKKFILIQPEMMKAPEIIDLQMRKGFVPVIINDVPDDYYEEVFERILNTAGVCLEKGLKTSAIVSGIRRLAGKDFSEEDMDWMIEKAMKRASERNSKELSRADLAIDKVIEISAEERLKRMPGLKNVKDMITEFTAFVIEAGRNKSIRGMHSSMIFYGNPGTGKTTCARLLADIMAEKGVSNTSFTMASRSDIIGKYVGHTASKISELFDKARGGILFVDEAGFFLNEASGGYVREAIKEFVRFMEIYPDVTVIFAMYEKEANAFMNLDEGLSSRISRTVAFDDFSDRELGEIFVHMMKEKGYSVSRSSIDKALEYLEDIKNNKNFGNARDVRKLAESVIISHAVRLHSDIKSPGKNTGDIIGIADVRAGIERLRRMPKNRRRFGFEYAQGAVLPLY
ncbi:MAG: AAA family ATPase [Lachnospiraceae bacterium]|nr:AAA family ATPase [Lachnospiraceae bacterium]